MNSSAGYFLKTEIGMDQSQHLFGGYANNFDVEIITQTQQNEEFAKEIATQATTFQFPNSKTSDCVEALLNSFRFDSSTQNVTNNTTMTADGVNGNFENSTSSYHHNPPPPSPSSSHLLPLNQSSPVDVKPSATPKKMEQTNVKSTGWLEEQPKENEILTLPVRELNKVLTGLPKKEILQIKRQRRTIKNRGYAQVCRSKRQKEWNEIQMKNWSLQIDLHCALLETNKLRQERDYFKRMCERLQAQKKVEIQSQSHVSNSNFYNYAQ